MKLQEFIEKNKGKSYGDGEFLYDYMPIFTRWYEGHILEVRTWLPILNGFGFLMRIDERSDLDEESKKMGELVAFYEWIKDIFIPAFDKALLERVQSGRKI